MSKYCRKCGVQLYADHLRYSTNSYMREKHDDQCKECNPESYTEDVQGQGDLWQARKERDQHQEVI